MGMIRNKTITSVAPIYGTSSVMNCDAASMYPSSMGGGKSVIRKGVTYYVKNEYPFDIEKINQTGDGLVYTKREMDLLMHSTPFDRRLDAEKDRLKELVHYHDYHMDYEESKKCKIKLENIENDHPEWLI